MAKYLSDLQRITNFNVDADAEHIAIVTADQEQSARFKELTAAVAWEVGTTIRNTFLASEAAKEGDGIVIQIETVTGHTLFSAAVGEAPAVGPDNWLWVRGKANVVKRFGVSSLRKGREIAAKGQTPESKGLGLPEYACHGGGFPIYLANNNTAPVGVIVVSGLPQLEDHQLIVDALIKADHVLAAP